MERHRAMAAHASPNSLVSRIIQVALGLFVTTSDLPPLPPNHSLLPYDCSFDTDCRWMSVGNNVDRWRVARGEPDSLLWLAATGTMQLPQEPFALIEQRGQKVDSLMTDEISCQKGTANLAFSYWAIGSADLEICLTDLNGEKFNCTGWLHSPVMPGKVSLKIPQLQKPFRIQINPNGQSGILIIDDIKYDAAVCQPELPFPKKEIEIIEPTQPPLILPWTKATSRPPINPIKETTKRPTTRTTTTTTSTTNRTTTRLTTTTEAPTTQPEVVSPEEPEEIISSSKELIKGLPETRVTPNSGMITIPATTTDMPFDLLIYGNLTQPLFDRRIGVIANDSSKLLCDFNDEFACQWGAEAGRWAIVQQGAIPSIGEAIPTGIPPPTFPAALVLQGTAMLTSDPIRCQTGPGKLLFRYWSNGDILLQACALGYGVDSSRIDCVDQSTKNGQDPTLAVFDFPRSIKEPFTLNIVPQWAKGVQNRYLIMDEIAYIGECSPPVVTKTTILLPTGRPHPLSGKYTKFGTKENKGTLATIQPATIVSPTPPVPTRRPLEILPVIPDKFTLPTTRPRTTDAPEPPTEEPTVAPEDYFEFTEEPRTRSTIPSATFPPRTTTQPPLILTRSKERQTFPNWRSTTPRSAVFPERRTRPPVELPSDYCSILNCNFDENACNYLNHGLTKVPWTLRNRGYGYPLSGQTDIRPTHANGQFVSTILAPGDIAILESPRFNMTTSLNVLLFQYYRPTHMATIRLCLGSRYTSPMRTAASFTQCPSILRSVTSKNAFRWNTVHVQIPPGTTNFFLVAQNSERAETRSAIAIDNMRVAICDPRNYSPEDVQDMFDPYDLDIE